MMKIDAHAHVYGDHPPLLRTMRELGVKVLNVCVAHEAQEDWRRRRGDGYRDQARANPDQFAWCTTFDLPAAADFADRHYARRAIDRIERDFAAGAVGVKVWKSIGMELKNPFGRFVMIDDAIFEPIFAHLEQTGRTLLMHMGEPLACWQPLTPGRPHYSYYSQNPRWHMYGRPVPSHGQIIAARDRVIERHPRLRVVGAHLGSLEHDLEEMARRLEAHKNFAMDTSGRLDDLKMLPTAKLREFFLRYQDRLLFGTDNGIPPKAEMSQERQENLCRSCHQTYEREFVFFETDQALEIFSRPTRGLNLPQDVLAKFYAGNARWWYPGL